MKKILALFAALIIAMMGMSAPASASGSDDPTPYDVTTSGVTLHGDDTFRKNGHINIRYTVPGEGQKSKGIHFDPNNNQPGGAWIGKKSIPWSAFEINKDSFCITWVQISHLNQHYGEGGQEPVCIGDQSNEPDPDPEDPTPGPDNKKITVCHYKANPGANQGSYSRVRISINGWFNGHRDHDRDIWEAFSYTNKGGQVVNVEANGDTSLLEFKNCNRPPVDQEIAIPAVAHVDKCGTDNDTITPVTDDNKYTTVIGDRVGDSITVTFSAKDGFVFPGGKKVVKVTVDFPNNDDCDLPETGGEAQYNVNMGIAAVAGVILLIGAFYLLRRKKS